MAREKGMGSLQREKSGRWTMRVGIKGKRYSRSTGTTDRDKAEAFLQRFLSPLGLGERRLPLADVWLEYVKSPNRNELAPATLNSKRLVWMHFAKWMEHFYLSVKNLAEVTPDMIAEYLACLRANICATTYNNKVCVLREMFRTLAKKAGLEVDPWEGVKLRPDDSHSRRGLTIDELKRLLAAAKTAGGADDGLECGQWHGLFIVGIYTGLRLGDCCLLEWASVHLDEGVIQLIPRKTRKHARGLPVTIPIHPVLDAELRKMAVAKEGRDERYVLPQLAENYACANWRVCDGLARIFRKAGIVTSVQIEGRRYKAPEATFHSLRHTFVSLAANAGVPLPVVQSIVGHTSTAMTRHYYHESEAELRRAVNAIPDLAKGGCSSLVAARTSKRSLKEEPQSLRDRLRAIEQVWTEGMISSEEFMQARKRILATV